MHWGWYKMAAILQMTFSNAFSWMKMYKFRLRFHWGLFQMVQITIFQHSFGEWLGANQATSHFLKQWMLVYWCIYASLGLHELTRRDNLGLILLHWNHEIISNIEPSGVGNITDSMDKLRSYLPWLTLQYKPFRCLIIYFLQFSADDDFRRHAWNCDRNLNL